MITKISLVLLVSFFIASCGNDKNANSVNGSSNRLTFSVDCDSGDCQDADLNDKNYIFAVSEKENCNDLMTGNELNYTNILYISKSSLTGEKTICTSAGCKFSTDRFFIKSGAEQIEFPKDKMLIAIAWIDSNNDNTFNSGDLVQCLEDDESIKLVTGPNTITFKNLNEVI